MLRISMNTQELQVAERNEVKALQETIKNDNFMDVVDKMDAVREKYRILRRENQIVTEYYFPAEEWATLSQKAKTIILDMVDEAERYEQLREDLQDWIEQAP